MRRIVTIKEIKSAMFYLYGETLVCLTVIEAKF